jgi:alpha-tubulin suppressor-like RCC1 family protein
MSLRQMFAGSIVKPGLNPLVAPTPSYTYNLYSWGLNTSGQLGLGNRTNYSSPKQIGALADWNVISGSRDSSFAIKTDLVKEGLDGKGEVWGE